ncbi:MAG: hypothetical protein IPL70_01315 [Uliginosibacterium sp.]|jgi:hypothetical protein|nr:hypothetical protein [Uliginosibacterium sp.]
MRRLLLFDLRDSGPSPLSWRIEPEAMIRPDFEDAHASDQIGSRPGVAIGDAMT